MRRLLVLARARAVRTRGNALSGVRLARESVAERAEGDRSRALSDVTRLTWMLGLGSWCNYRRRPTTKNIKAQKDPPNSQLKFVGGQMGQILAKVAQTD